MIEPRDTYIDPLLSNVAINYRPSGHIADMVFPVAPVIKQAGYYQIVEKADTFRLPGTTIRAPGTRARRTDFRIGSANYFADNYALGGDFSIEEISNAVEGLNLQTGKVEFTQGQLLGDYDARVSALALTDANVGSYATPASLWSARASGNSDPLGDIKAGIDSVHFGTGFKPNRAIIGADVWSELKWHADIRGVLFPHGGGVPTVEQLANMLDLETVLIGGAMYNASADDDTTFTPTQFWGGNMVIYYAPSAPSLVTPSWGYSFRWSPQGKTPFGVRRFPYDVEADTQRYDIQYYQDEKITDANLAYKVQSAI